jgi:mannose-6-phosphate isomerase-like protein (cupin superfamily)
MTSSFDPPSVEAAVSAAVQGETPSEAAEAAATYGRALLPVIERHLLQDLPFDTVERLERLVKLVVRSACATPPSGAEARDLALFQQRVGLLLKYKPYTIKASHPFGYSIFLHNPGEGFSFQQHLTHKVELFHILEVQPGGYIFVCDCAEWTRFYEREGFARWLLGEPNPACDRYRFYPKVGDVVSIDRLRMVHTVIGCTLEEFATTSTDMVDRLHDQNRRDSIPAKFCRTYARDRLRSLRAPRMSRRVHLTAAGFETQPIPASGMQGGHRVVLEDRFLTAARYVIAPGQSTETEYAGGDAVALYVLEGAGTLAILAPDELASPPPEIPVAAGDALLVTSGMHFRMAAQADSALVLSLHRAPYQTLLPVEG